MTKLMQLPLDKINISGGTQTRAIVDESTAEDYAEALRAGAEFPPGDVFYDGETYWLAAGFHRHRAHTLAGRVYMDCHVHSGDRRAALLFGMAANQQNALRLSPDDKRRAVALLLMDPEWGQWSDREIARCAIGNNGGAALTMVAEMRERLSALTEQIGRPARKVERNGTTYEQNTTSIGKKRTRQESDDAQWLAAAASDLEAARESLTRVHTETGQHALAAVDLSLSLVRGVG